jgi:hypothetical protein
MPASIRNPQAVLKIMLVCRNPTNPASTPPPLPRLERFYDQFWSKTFYQSQKVPTCRPSSPIYSDPRHFFADYSQSSRPQASKPAGCKHFSCIFPAPNFFSPTMLRYVYILTAIFTSYSSAHAHYTFGTLRPSIGVLHQSRCQTVHSYTLRKRMCGVCSGIFFPMWCPKWFFCHLWGVKNFICLPTYRPSQNLGWQTNNHLRTAPWTN